MNMNIAEILKDCPKGTKLYSPIFGEVILEAVDINVPHPILVTINNKQFTFEKEGQYYRGYNQSECLLFPSKENRDWSTFKIPNKEYEFKPFDKVLVKDCNDKSWYCDLFSHYNNEQFVCVGGIWKVCVPYEGNEHLLGTTNNPD